MMSFSATLDRLPTPAEAPAPRRKGTLLVVDDEDGPRQSLRVIFKDDYDILMAGDGPSAIALAQNQRVDVAVLDIRMAGMSGIEVLERLKFVDPAIEVVMMTAFETTDTIRQALRLRACDYINKPFDISTMRAAVAKGETPIGSAWVQYPLGFYIFALLFVAFDVDIVFIIAWAVIFKPLGVFGFFEILFFIAVLAIGLAYAWRKGVVRWI